MLGVYLFDNEEEMQEVQRLRVGGIIDIVGTVGFSFLEGLHYSHTWNVNNTHVGLEYFRTYDAQARPSTAQHFSKIQDVNGSGRLVPCAAWGIYSQHLLWSYLNLTGRRGGRRPHLRMEPVQYVAVSFTIFFKFPVVPRKAVAEVSKIGNYRRDELP